MTIRNLLFMLATILMLSACKRIELEPEPTNQLNHYEVKDYFQFEDGHEFVIFYDHNSYGVSSHKALYHIHNGDSILYIPSINNIEDVRGVYIASDGSKIVSQAHGSNLAYSMIPADRDETFDASLVLSTPSDLKHINYDPVSKTDMFVGTLSGKLRVCYFNGSSVVALDYAVNPAYDNHFASMDTAIGLWSGGTAGLVNHKNGVDKVYSTSQKIENIRVIESGKVYFLANNFLKTIENGSIAYTDIGAYYQISKMEVDKLHQVWFIENNSLYRFRYWAMPVDLLR